MGVVLPHLWRSNFRLGSRCGAWPWTVDIKELPLRVQNASAFHLTGYLDRAHCSSHLLP